MDVRLAYNDDKIQRLVSTFASEPFSIQVFFCSHGGQEYPVIFVPQGVRTPVCCKKDLPDEDNKFLLRENDIFVRTLSTNNTVSSARLPWKDLPTLVERCFANRETNVIPFLSKVLQSLDKKAVQQLRTALSQKDKDSINSGSSLTAGETLKQDESRRVLNFLNLGADRFQAKQKEEGERVPHVGTWEVAMCIVGTVPPHQRGITFLKLLESANPNLTGWPVWFIADASSDPADRPYTLGNKWEELLALKPSEGFNGRGHLDFMILDPDGSFYLLRGLEDDLLEPSRLKPREVLDPFNMLYRIGEALIVGKDFARAMGCRPETAKLHFYFRWRGLKGRFLRSWGNPTINLRIRPASQQDEVSQHVELSIDANHADVAVATHSAISPLLHCFGGHEMPLETVQHWIERLISRR
jgi:hypothetical protein